MGPAFLFSRFIPRTELPPGKIFPLSLFANQKIHNEINVLQRRPAGLGWHGDCHG
jgi:hypothetical protein